MTFETDEQVMNRMRARFEILDDMTAAAAQGTVRAMIVAGPPGVGKSFGVEKVLSKYDLFPSVANDESLKRYEIVKGAVSALGLYAKLYTYSSPKHVLVFDDCDVWDDEDAVNILKSALDTSERRVIQYNKDSRFLKDYGIPNKFEYRGGAIFISNIKSEHYRSKKLRAHLEALESRCHYLDLTIDTTRDKLLRIKQIVADGMLNKYQFDNDKINEIINFIDINQNKLVELSLRTVVKAADLRVSFGDEWQRYANTTLIRR